eukprot:2027068-Amphidinium_carterae.3
MEHIQAWAELSGGTTIRSRRNTQKFFFCACAGAILTAQTVWLYGGRRCILRFLFFSRDVFAWCLGPPFSSHSSPQLLPCTIDCARDAFSRDHLLHSPGYIGGAQHCPEFETCGPVTPVVDAWQNTEAWKLSLRVRTTFMLSLVALLAKDQSSAQDFV